MSKILVIPEVGVIPVAGKPLAVIQSGTWITSGTFSIDQTTNGTTNAVYIKNSSLAATQSGSWKLSAPNDGTYIGSVKLTDGTHVVDILSDGSLSSQIAKYNSTLPTLSSGNTTFLQTDTNGRLIVTDTQGTKNVSIQNATLAVSQSGTWGVNINSGQSIAATQSGPWVVGISTGQSIAVTQSGTWNIGTLGSITGTVKIKADTLANQTDALKVTLNGEKPVLAAGTAIIGKVGIDQTTDGTTNKVYVGNTVSVGTHAVTQSGIWNIGTLTTLTGITNTVSIAASSTQANDLKVTLDGENVVLGAGTNGIGKLNSNSGVDIGDVTINNAAGEYVPIAGTTSIATPTKKGILVDGDGHLQIDILTSPPSDMMFNGRADQATGDVTISLPLGYRQVFIEHVIVVPPNDTDTFTFEIFENAERTKRESVYLTDNHIGRIDDLTRLYYYDTSTPTNSKIYAKITSLATGNFLVKIKGRLMR